MPTAKKDHYTNVKPDSLKQFLMMQKDWAEEQIRAHGNLMKSRLEGFNIY